MNGLNRVWNSDFGCLLSGQKINENNAPVCGASDYDAAFLRNRETREPIAVHEGVALNGSHCLKMLGFNDQECVSVKYKVPFNRSSSVKELRTSFH